MAQQEKKGWHMHGKWRLVAKHGRLRDWACNPVLRFGDLSLVAFQMGEFES